jgi:2-polyprenyl-3-methyl-5-hydroxy-6-metoxy-1,4-benzoquinol methylase
MHLVNGAPPTDAERAARWREEAGFFDARAPAEIRPIDPRVVARYTAPRHPWFNKEYRFRLLGPLVGHRVLDVGCGMGENAILLALAGAEVTGIDVSPRSIELARARARASGLALEPRFVCAPVEIADLPAGTFDLVWGDGVLHHVIPELERVMARLRAVARPQARFVFSEPVNRLPLLRRLRESLPIAFDATAGERPLEEEELAIVRRYVPDLTLRAFSLFGRLNRFLLPARYEGAPLARRAAASALCAADFALLAVEPLARTGAMAVLHGRFG